MDWETPVAPALGSFLCVNRGQAYKAAIYELGNQTQEEQALEKLTMKVWGKTSFGTGKRQAFNRNEHKEAIRLS